MLKIHSLRSVNGLYTPMLTWSTPTATHSAVFQPMQPHWLLMWFSGSGAIV